MSPFSSIRLAAIFAGFPSLQALKKIHTGALSMLALMLVMPEILFGQSQTFNYSGSIQTFTVPAGVFQLTVDARGAQGGTSGSNSGGLGARMVGVVNVTPGQVIQVLVGEQGASGTQGGGGGGSFVVAPGNTPLVVAGGGGGAYYSSYTSGSANMAGSVNTSGNSGYHGMNGTVEGLGGSNGNGGASGNTYTGDGSGGGGFYTNGGDGSPGQGGRAFVNGGAGGLGAGSGGRGGFGGGGGADWSNWTGAGGGGGYSGGGAGTYYGVGGGGGSFVSGTTTTATAGFQSGNGQVTLSWVVMSNCSGTPSTPTIAINNLTQFSSCSGASVNLTSTGTSQDMGVNFQWQTGPSSTGPWTNISGATSTSYATSAVSSQWYRLVSTCSFSTLSSNSNSVELVVSPIAAPTASGTTINCGTSTTLTATGSTGSYAWYTASTGGTLLGSGSMYTTPVLSATTTYYVEAQSGVTTSTQTFSFTGGVQTFTVPNGVYSLSVDARGASGGTGSYGTGGLGGRTQAVLSVTPGQVISIYVGGTTSSITGGYNGGGSASNTSNRGGGGATDLRIGGTQLSDRVLVAGGGGGSGYNCGSGDHGGNAGGLIGADGWQCNSQTSYVGLGGTQSAGGLLGQNFGQGCATNGALGVGGNGACTYGGGGGGGYYGGGGGGYGGGGGGSSYVNPNGSSAIVHTAGYNTGNGQVTLSYTVIPCASARTAVVVNVTPLSTPTSNGTTINCGVGTTLTASGSSGSYGWYSTSTGGTPLSYSPSYTTPNLTATTTYWVEANSGGQLCTSQSLSGMLNRLTSNGSVIEASVPTPYNFSMDGPGGNNSTYISDGGNDMYDGGNYINTNLQSNITYSEGVVLSSSAFGSGGQYTTRKLNGMWVLAANMNGVSSFSITGNNGADGSGTVSATNFNVTVGCQTYTVFLKRVYNAGDPSINQMVIIPQSTTAGHTWDTNTDNTLHTITGLSSTTRLYYLLYAGNSGGFINDTQAQTIAQTFLTEIQAAVNVTPTCTSSRIPVVVNVNPISSPTASGTTITCASTANLTVSGSTGSYAWFTTGTGGTAVSTSPNFTTPLLYVTTTYFVEAVSGICSSPRVPVVINIPSIASPTASGTAVQCGSTATLTASGSNGVYAWYDVQVGGNPISNSATLITPALFNTTSYYVEAVNGLCPSPRTVVTVTVNPLTSPTSQNVDLCGSGSVTLTAAGSTGTYRWYTTSVGGTPVGSNPTYTTPTLNSSTTYWLEAQGTANSGTQTFNFTGSVQTFTVPAGVTQLTVDARGASGGGGTFGNAGLGGRTQAVISVTPGQVLNLYVGGTTTSITGGYNGGGNAVNSTNARGGGGATDIRIGGTNLTDRVLVAAGGGGAGTNCGNNNHGGNGGGTTGADGWQCGSQSSYVGLGGTQSAGGTLGNNQGQGCGTSGTLGVGGTGACTYGGGGGGGYYGGGGGGYGGGGGGSSWVTSNGSSSIVHTPGVNTGDGQLTLTWTGTTCTSNRIPVVVNSNCVLVPGTAQVNGLSTISICANTNFTLSTVGTTLGNGITYQWQSAGSNSGPWTNISGGTTQTFVTNTAITGWYRMVATVTQSGQIDSTNAIQVVIAPLTPPTVSNATIMCGVTTTLVASGSTGSFEWFANSTGGSPIGTSPSYTTPILSATTTYYVEAYTGSTCRSARVPVVVTVNPVSAPLASGTTVNCGTTTTLTASGSSGTYAWYTASTGGTLLSSSPNYITPALTNTTTYFVEAVSGVISGNQTFSFTGSVQTFTVPAGVFSINVDARGASGGSSSFGNAGLGGRVQATLSVTPGQVLNIYVGGTTSTTTGGYNGGGSASSSNNRGGGGATDIRIGGTNLTDRVLVAAGGGGSGYNCGSNDHGGNGGGLTGADGWQCNSQTSYVGLGGTQTAGGLLGQNFGQGCATNGSLGLGGNGACTYGGGGGGGYYGGGGGGYGGGGGGSSFVTSTGSSAITHTAGVNTGNGQLVISYSYTSCISSSRTPVVVNVVPVPDPVANGTTIACGATATLTAGGSTGSYGWYTTSTGGTPLTFNPTYTTPALSATTTYYVDANSGSPGCVGQNLSTLLSNINANASAIEATVPSAFNFAMDGPGGNNANYISDGGNDMYDGGNYLSTNFLSNFNYSEGLVVASSAFGSGGQFVTRKLNGMWVLAADMNGVTTFSITGNNGADGSGTVSATNFNVTVGCQTYRVFLKRVYNAGDPSINQMVIIPQSTTAGHTWDTNTDNTLHTITGLSGTTRMYYLLYAGSSGLFINDTQAQTIATTFLTQAAAGVIQNPVCTSNRIPVVVTVTPVSSPTGTGATTTCGATATLSATGSTGTFAWFTTSTGGTAVSTSPSFTTPALFVTTTYYVEATSGICSSPRVPVVVTIPSIASPTASGSSMICGSTTTLTASGSSGSYAWYTAPTGGTAISTAASYTTPVLFGTTTYYVEAVNGLCPSPRTTVVVTVNPISAPVSQDVNLCGSGTVTLTATGSTGSYSWYTVSTGGTPVGSNPTYTTPTLNSTTTYFVESRGAINSGTQTFGFTGSVQTFTVPAGVTQLTVDARGASGGGANFGNGGMGGRTQAVISVTPGQILNLYVGGTTTTITGGYNGGGSAINSTNGRGGGGASDIRIGGTALTDRVLVAAGGGGAGTNCGNNNHGGNGGGTTGADGWQCGSQTSYVGLGGTQSAGGALGNNQGQGCGTNGALGVGGTGACTYGGGGGGGYYGGGGGGYGGGGGGSSWVTSVGSSSITHTPGFNTGDGQITLTWSGTGCVSNRTPVTVISNCVLTSGTATVNNQNTLSICASTNFTLSSNGATLGNGVTYQWQNAPTSTGPWSSISGGTTLSYVTSNTVTSWYRMLVTVTQTGQVDSTNAIEVVIAPLTPPTVSGTTILCAANTTLVASGSTGSYEWYANSTGGSPIATTASYTTPNLSVTTSYFVEAFIGSCRSVRTQAVVTVTPVPSPTVSSGATINCGSTAVLTVSGSSGNYAWYTVSTGGTAIGTNATFTTPTLTASTTYFAEAVSGTSGGSTTLSYTGSIQTFTVPAGVTSITIDGRGAQGGTSGSNPGGLGARMVGTFAVTPGQVLQILVGQQGGTGTQQGGGGGGTFVVASGNTPLLVAGGGGGGHYASYTTGVSTNMNGTTGTAGMAGYNGNNGVVAGAGGANGSGGFTSTSYPTGGGSGGGGFNTNGVNGNASTGGAAYVNGGTAGQGAGFPNGGHGGYGGGGGADWANWTGGGGGGGYSGGGAGVYYGCGGGGGSYNAGSAQSNTSGFQTGNGQVIISWSGVSCTSARVPVPVTVTPLASPTANGSSISCGATTTLTASGSSGSYEWYATDTGSTVIGSSASFTTPNLTATTTYYVQATTGNQGCLPNSLATVLSNMTANTNAIQATIPSAFNFTMDGPNGNNSNYISDGGNDMYDGGNYINTNLLSNINYSDNTIVSSSAFGTGGQYFTRKMNGIWVLAANMNGVSSFSITGNNGADGSGSVSATNFNVTIGCQTFTVFLKRVFNAGDPSINQMVIIPQSTTAGHTWDSNTDNTLHTISGLSGTTRMYYLLYSGTGGLFINDTQAQTIATTFLNQVVAVQPPQPYCASARVPVVVTVPVIATPSAAPATIICGNSTTLTATGSTGSYAWFLSNTGGNAVGTTATYTTPVLNATTTYFVEAVSGICSSTRVAVPVTVNPLPDPAANSVVLCGPGSTTLTATGSSGTYRWYTTSTGGSPVSTTPTYTTPFLSSTTTYYVESMGQLNSGTQTFNFTGGVQSFTVPAGVTRITVDARGASGGGGTMGNGGLGGRTQAVLNVTPGQTLNIYVGGTTTSITGGFNGGGNAINSSNARGGGGASDIRLGGTALSDRLLVAAGGGGAGTNCGNNNHGGNGGGLIGSDGWQCGSQTSYVGLGGTQTAGGVLGNNQGQGCGTNGTLGAGGTGACTYGGGGGGGYYGGGGGGYGGGGGGSSWVTSSGSSDIVHTPAFNTGNGQIVISWTGQPCLSNRVPVIAHVVAVPSTPVPSSNSPVCTGDSLRLTTQNVINGDYLWVGPNGYTSNLQNPILPNANANYVGTYTVHVAIMGCTAPSATTSVMVNDSVTSISVSANSPLCSGETLNLSGSAGPNNSLYSWNGPNGYTSVQRNNVISSVPTTAQGRYTYTVTSPGCNTLTDTISVRIIPTVPALLGSNSPLCQGSALYLSTNLVPGSPYIWTGPNGFSSTQQSPSISNATPLASGVYTLTVQQPGCNPLTYQTTVVVSNAIVNINLASNAPVCTGATLSLSATTIPGATYLWTGPSGYTASTPVISMPNVDTTYSGLYSLQVSNTACGVQSRSMNALVQPPLVFSAISNSPVCQGGNLFMSTTSHNLATYQWNGPSAFATTTQNPSISNVSLNASGNYTVVVNQPGCGTASTVVPVTVGPRINTVQVGSNSPVCSGLMLQFSATNLSGATYSWIGPNGFTGNQSQHSIPNVSTAASGNYSVTLSSPGCANYSLPVSVMVYPNVSLTASSNGPVCQGSLVNLSATFMQDATYQWFGPSGFQSTSQNPAITNAQTANSGVYTVISSQPSCGTQTSTVTVVVSPAMNNVQLGSNSPVCTGGSLLLTTTAASGVTYLWSGPNGYTSSQANPPAILPASTLNSGVYSLVVTSPGCATVSLQTAVTVNPTLNLTASANSPLCEGAALYLSASDHLNATYSWSGPGGYSSSSRTPSLQMASVSNSGVYTVVVTQPGCGTQSQTVSVSVGPSPAAVSWNTNSPVCSGSALNLTATNVSGMTYLWQGPGGYTANTASATIPAANSLNAGVYTLTLSSSGCPTLMFNTTVAVNSALSLSAGPLNNPVCQGSVISLTSTYERGAVYAWSGPNGFSSNLQNPSIAVATLSNSGVYSLTVIQPGCGAFSTTTTVGVGASLSNVNGGSNSPVCTGGTLNLTSANINGVSYLWTGPLGFTSNQSTVTFTNITTAVAGNYTLTASSPGCGSVSYLVKVVVNNPVGMSASNNTPICSGSAVQLAASGAPRATYSWTGPDNFASNLQSPSISNAPHTASGVYTVIINDPTCGPLAFTTTVQVGANLNVVTASSNSPVCVNGNLQLSATSIPGAVYSWAGPVGYTAAVASPVISPVNALQAGVYSVTVSTVGCIPVTRTTSVTVNPVLLASPGSNSPICQGGVVYLTGNTATGATYYWEGPGGFVSTLPNPSLVNAQPASTGVYTYTINSPSCGVVSATTTVTVGGSVSNVTLSSNGPVCTGNQLNLSSSLVSSGTIVWTAPDGFTSNLQNPVRPAVLSNAGGVYTYSVNSPGCGIATRTLNVTVNAAPVLIPGSNSPVCQGNAIILTVNTVSGSTYSWTGPASFASAVQNPSISNAQPVRTGIYTLVVTNSSCGSTSTTLSVAVNSSLGSLSATSNTPLCVGSNLNLSITNRTGFTFAWTGPNGFTGNTANPVRAAVTTADAGRYSVVVSSAGCGSTTVQTNPVVVNDPSSVSASSTGTLCAGGVLYLYGTAPLSSTYSWSGPGGYASTVQNPARTNAQSSFSGVYTLNANVPGCGVVFTTTTVTVNVCRDRVTVDQVATGTGAVDQAVSDAQASGQSGLELNTSTLTVWPNPNQGNLVNLRWTGLSGTDAEVTIRIYDAIGKSIYLKTLQKGDANEYETTVEFWKTLSSGVYTIETVHNGFTHYQKLMVR